MPIFSLINAEGLDDMEIATLEADVDYVAKSEDLSLHHAEKLLLKRIGGQRNLKSYVGTLVAGLSNKAGLSR